MGEDRGLGTDRPEQLDLRRRVRDVILATDHMGNGKVGVVDDARGGIEKLAVLADQHGVGKRCGVDALLAADEIVPDDRRTAEAESPIGPAPFALETRPILRAQCQRRAIIDRWLAHRGLQAALGVELGFRFVAGIKQPLRLQPFQNLEMPSAPFGLPHETVMHEAEPGEILDDALFIRGGAAARIGVVDPQKEAAAMAARKQPVQDRGPHVAQMQPAGGRWREADRDRHLRPPGSGG